MLHARLGGRGSHLAISSRGDGVEISLRFNLRMLPYQRLQSSRSDQAMFSTKMKKTAGGIRAQHEAERKAQGVTGGERGGVDGHLQHHVDLCFGPGFLKRIFGYGLLGLVNS